MQKSFGPRVLRECGDRVRRIKKITVKEKEGGRVLCTLSSELGVLRTKRKSNGIVRVSGSVRLKVGMSLGRSCCVEVGT